MKPHPEPKNNRFRWLTSHKSIVLVTAFGLLILAFQLNKLLSSSFRLEIFGIEIIEVQKLEAHEHEAPAEELPVLRPRPAPRAPLPPPPPLPPEPEEPTQVFVVVEEMPELIGGLAALLREIRYPVIAKRAGVEGRVIVQFIVDEQGRVGESKVVRGIGAGCDEEALRALHTRRFRPGKQRGKAVRVKMSLPVTFRLGQ
ncbi:MAG: energy transducer TonB [Bacteroidetes bacterium]|nr:energy transducer TonB [Bacteroidota bacterium]